MQNTTPTATQLLLAKNLETLRKEKGLKQSFISEKSGVIASTYSRIESCIVSPNLSTLEKIAKAFEVPIAEFFRKEEVVEQTLLDKLELIQSMSEYNQSVVGILLDTVIAKDKLEKSQEVKMKRRLEQLDKARKND